MKEVLGKMSKETEIRLHPGLRKLIVSRSWYLMRAGSVPDMHITYGYWPWFLLFLFLFLFYFETMSSYVAQTGLELIILLSQLLKCWDYWVCATTHGSPICLILTA